MSAKTSARQRAWMQKVQERLDAICGVLADMKAVKLLALRSTILQRVTGLRETEVIASQGYLVLLIWSLFIGMLRHKVLSADQIIWHSLTWPGCMPQLISLSLTFAVFAIISAVKHDRARQNSPCGASFHIAVFDLFAHTSTEPASPSRAATSGLFGMFRSHRGIPRAAGEGRHG